jgi:hypothetical protein
MYVDIVDSKRYNKEMMRTLGGMCGTMDDEVDISGSYNGSTPGSEPVNEGPTPSPEAIFESQIDFE